jgi:hypothetical protein
MVIVAAAAAVAVAAVVAVGATGGAESAAAPVARESAKAVPLPKQVATLRSQLKTLRRRVAGIRSGPGPAGAPGAAGAQGPAGPTVGGFAATTRTTSLNPPGFPQRVMALSIDGGGPVRMTAPGRILVTANVLAGTNNGVSGKVFCWPVLGTDPSAPSFANSANVDVPGTMNASASVTVVGSAAVAAGSHDISIVCLLNGPGSISTFTGNMVAVGLPG